MINSALDLPATELRGKIVKRHLSDVFIDLIMKVYLTFMIFDGIRSYMTIGSSISFVKDILLILIVIFWILKADFKISRYEAFSGNLTFLVYILFVGTAVIYLNDVDANMVYRSYVGNSSPTGFALHFRIVESNIILLLFYKYQGLTNRPIKHLADFFIYLCVGYVVLTLIAYFVIDLSAIFEAHWFGRISIGYPTSDTQMLSMGLAYLLFTDSFKGFKRNAFTAIVALGIMMQSTATGMISVVVIVLFYIYFNFNTRNLMKLLQPRFLLILSFASLLFLGAVYVLNTKLSRESTENFYLILDAKVEYIGNKIYGFLPFTDDNESSFESSSDNKFVGASEESRKSKIDRTFMTKKDVLSMVIGGPASLAAGIENQHYTLLRAYGYVGLCIYYLWIAYLFLKAHSYRRYWQGKLMLVAAVLLLISNLSTITSYMFNIITAFGLVYAYAHITVRDKIAGQLAMISKNNLSDSKGRHTT
ncbi:MAG: hypothetical protein INR69_03885 [Mucilaginibacter polytrichastri]|nr:hypothetical protein [Mucilaginibacter polytrichastri]